MIKRLFFAVVLLTILSAQASAQTSITDSIISGGIYRKYILYVPAVYHSSYATPLVINMHGYTSNAQQQQYYGNFMPVADTANFLVVHPQGTKDSGGYPFWNAGISSSLINDVQFISGLIDSLGLSYNIDYTSVYATGLSNGGFMSHYLACVLNNRIAAIASVAGTMFTQQYGTCTPGRAVPAMQIHGTADGTVPYAGNSSEEPVDTVVNFWRRNNHCLATAQFSNVPNTSTTDNCTAEHYVYTGGTNGSTVELYKIIGGDHSWPGASVNINTTNMDFSASVEIWRFFRKYHLTTPTGISEAAAFAASIVAYPNPVSGQLTVSSKETTIDKIVVTDLSGRIMGEQASRVIDMSAFSPGIYFLKAWSKDNFTVKKIIRE